MFPQYRSMSGGRFLVSLREVSTPEKNIGKPIFAQIGRQYYRMQEELKLTGGDFVDAFVQKLELDE